jgi:prophage regulatory protein
MRVLRNEPVTASEVYMRHQSSGVSALALWRRFRVLAEGGFGRSTLYSRIDDGLWTKPVNLGGRIVGWPAGEVTALNSARIAGQSDQEIRTLVARLHAQRRRDGEEV